MSSSNVEFGELSLVSHVTLQIEPRVPAHRLIISFERTIGAPLNTRHECLGMALDKRD